MTRPDDQRLADIRAAAAELDEIVRQGREVYDDDRIRQRAAERLLEIIGEAANALTAARKNDYPEVAWRDIARLRILLAHHYHRIDPDQVWAIAAEDIPAMLRQIEDER